MSLFSLSTTSSSNLHASTIEEPSIQISDSNRKQKKGSLILRGGDKEYLIKLSRENRVTTSTGMVRIQFDKIIKFFFAGARKPLWDEFQQGATLENTKERFKRIVRVLIKEDETEETISKSTDNDSKEIADTSTKHSTHASLDLTTDELRELKEICEKHTLPTETNKPRRRIEKIARDFFIGERKKLWDNYRKPGESDANLHKRFTCFIHKLFKEYDLPASSFTSPSISSIEDVLTSAKVSKKKKAIVLSSGDKEKLIKICKQHQKLKANGVVYKNLKAIKADFFKDRPDLWKLFKSEDESETKAMLNFRNYINNNNIVESQTTNSDTVVTPQPKKLIEIKPKAKGRPKNANSYSNLLSQADKTILVNLANRCRIEKEKVIQVDWQRVKSEFFVGKKEELWKHFKKVGDEPGQDHTRFVAFAHRIIKQIGSKLPSKRIDLPTSQSSVEPTASISVAPFEANANAITLKKKRKESSFESCEIDLESLSTSSNSNFSSSSSSFSSLEMEADAAVSNDFDLKSKTAETEQSNKRPKK